MSPRTLILKTIGLFGLWILLSGKLDAFHLSIGFFGAALIAWINTEPQHLDEPPLPLARLVLYLPWLFWEVVKSSLNITKIILDPKLPINPRLVQYPTNLGSNTAVVLLGNSITLTPGTVTIEVSSSKLVIHALDDESSNELESRSMEQKIAEVFHSRGQT
jgi:multicomponent Na+:H+ antiporter subunit E|tara:strand:+ start:7052 stop:7534 length:483 start_codon:yes stop_codon:yes gene_type:complete